MGEGGVSGVERHSGRQLWVSVFVGLLAPAAALPAVLARGGSLGWLVPVAVFPLGLLVLWRVRRLGEEGLAQAWRGKGVVLTLYYLWAVAVAALTAGSCVDRLGRTDYVSAPGWLLSLAILGVTAYLVRKGPAAFFRAVQIFFLALVVVLALFFALGLTNLNGDNLAPGDWGEAGGLWQGVGGAGATLAVGVLAAFFPRKKEPGSSPGWRWLGGWCLTAAGLCLLVLGALGPKLAARAPLPFFLALQGLGFPGGFQRLEALGTAAWALSDLALLGLAALAGREMAGRRDWAVWPVLLGGFLGGCFLPNGAVTKAQPWLLGANLLLGGLLPVLLSLGAGKGRRERGGISCG